jgi:hypothetical protein
LRGTVKQTIKTKDQRSAKRVIAVVVIIVLIVIASISAVFYVMVAEQFPVTDGGPGAGAPVYLLVSLAFAQIISGLFLVVAACILASQRGRLKELKRSATFKSSGGIVYYRDFLKGVSPADISILMDLKLEDDKDVSATLLRLYDKKAIGFEGRKIAVTGKGDGLDASERELINMVKTGGINRAGIRTWKHNRLEEAKEKHYITRGGYRDFWGCFGCAPGIFLTFLSLVGFLFLIFRIDSGDWGAYDAFMNDPSAGNVWPMAAALLEINAMLLCLNMLFIIPVFMFIRRVTQTAIQRLHGAYVRTPEGDALTEKIAGLKRFIHEFSALDKVGKEQVALWNDFLVYAVVLEENEQIVRDISKLYNKENLLALIKTV